MNCLSQRSEVCRPLVPAPGAFAPSRWRTAATLLAVLCSVGLAAGTRGAEEPVAKEHQIKAAFIFNFLKFAEWPEKKFADASDPIVIGVVAEGPICSALEAAVKGRKINGRDIVVKVHKSGGRLDAVHLLCLAGVSDARVTEHLAAARDRNVLTVGDSEHFARAGGMIIFVPEGDKMRFEINIEAVERDGLKISAQLQKLAKSIRRQKE
jgi:hypothetical protein